nr:homeobox protein hoy1 [Quercus suber]
MADVMQAPIDLSPYHQQSAVGDQDGSKTLMQSQSRAGTPSNPNMHASSRRPPRKSTLTQQQKNQKRQRATQDQLMTLEVEFNKNPTPTALVRERIAQDINMTERSVQIWFQNRRAKIKNIAKKSIESGEDCDSIPDSMRQYLAMQAYGAGGKGHPAMTGRAGPGYPSYGGGTLCLNADPANGKLVIQHFACRSLSIGTWRRVGQSSMDLVIFYSPDKACITYYINNENSGYKIEYPFAWIKNISLEQGDVLSAAEGTSQRSGGLLIELTRPPKFYMDSSGMGGFYECGDFTEDQQATQVMLHHLGGPSKVLSGQLAKLVSLDAYQNRHNTFDPNGFAISAPVSPMRPASQPNHIVHPYHPTAMLQPDNAMGLMGPPAPRGHKRQRSRSVPAALDFSQLRHPLPSFLIQHEGQPTPATTHDLNIYAPVPHPHHATSFAPELMPMVSGSNLSIDTTAVYGTPMTFCPPMSATTANSPSEFGTPAFYASTQAGDSMPNVHFSTPFHNGFLAVEPGAMIGTSNTPLSMVSHGDPVIADHSPPLSSVGRSQSAGDIFATPSEHSQFGDDSVYLAESFNKQMALPFRSPLGDQSFHSPLANGDFDFSTSSGPGSMSFECGPSQNHDGSISFHSPGQQQGAQQHQDSAVSFSTPEQAMLFHSPKDNTMLYQDSKVYSSPGQMPQPSDEHHSMYQHSHLINGSSGDDMLTMYGTIDPHTLGHHHHQQ